MSYDHVQKRPGGGGFTPPLNARMKHSLPHSQSMDAHQYRGMLAGGEDSPPLPPPNSNTSSGRPQSRHLPTGPAPPLPPPNRGGKRYVHGSGSPGHSPATSHNTSPSHQSPKPPIPPKRAQQPSTYDVPRKTSTTSATKAASPIDEDNFKVVSKSMSLRELTENHQSEFPLKVKVSAGIFGNTEQETFSDGDLLNIHFVKQSRVVVVEKYGGRCVKVPLNSAAQFGVLYNPENNIKGAQIGYEFRTVNQLIAQKPMPRVVCALQQFKGATPESSLEENEVLVINSTKSGRPFGGKHIVCTQICGSRMTKKKLPENCIGCFSTKPSYVKLFLPEIIHHFELPVLAMVFLTAGYGDNDTCSENLIQVGEVVTITKVEVEKNVIATSALEDDPGFSPYPTQINSSSESPLFDIPIDIPVMEVQIIEPMEEDCEKLYEDTRCLFESYNPQDQERRQVKIQVGKDDIYYTAVRDDQQDVGVELIPPENIYMRFPKNTPAYDPPSTPSQEVPPTAPKPVHDKTRPPSVSQMTDRGMASAQEASLDEVQKSKQDSMNVTPTPPGENIDEYVYAVTDGASMNTNALQSSPLYTLFEQIDKSKQQQITELHVLIKSLRDELEQMKTGYREITRRMQGKNVYVCC